MLFIVQPKKQKLKARNSMKDLDYNCQVSRESISLPNFQYTGMAIWVRMSFLVNRRMRPDFRFRFARFFKTFVFDFFQMEYKAAIEGVILGLVTTLIFFGTMMLEHDFDEGNDIKFSSQILKFSTIICC